MSFEILTCCLSGAYTAMEKANNTRLYAIHVPPIPPPPPPAKANGCILPSGEGPYVVHTTKNEVDPNYQIDV